MLEIKGVPTKLAQKKNKKGSGIIAINQLFQDDELFVFEHCERIHKEFTLQVYKKTRNNVSVSEDVEKKFDDMTDCLRYIIVRRPEFDALAPIHEIEGGVYGRI